MVGGELLQDDLQVDIVTDGVLAEVPGQGGGQGLRSLGETFVLQVVGDEDEDFSPASLLLLLVLVPPGPASLAHLLVLLVLLWLQELCPGQVLQLTEGPALPLPAVAALSRGLPAGFQMFPVSLFPSGHRSETV